MATSKTLLLNHISVAGIECTLWSKQLLVFSRQIIGCQTTLPTSVIIALPAFFKSGTAVCWAKSKGLNLRRQIVAKATSLFDRLLR
jgi:hypothetical protein